MEFCGYIIEKYNDMKDAYTCRRLQEEGAALDMDVRIVGVHDTLVMHSGVHSGEENDADRRILTNKGQILKRRDFALMRYKWGRLKGELCSLAGRVYNPPEAYDLFINKYEQMKRLHSDAFRMPAWILGTSLSSWEMIAESLGGIFVAKGLESSMGQEIFLIQNKEDFRFLRERFGTEKEWLFEEFIRSSCGRDMRLFSLRGEVIGSMIRSSRDDFRANVALGGKVEACPADGFMRQAAADIYEQTGLDFVGIDLLFGEDLPYFCEINVMPGLEGMETASGRNIAGDIMRMIRDDLCGESKG